MIYQYIWGPNLLPTCGQENPANRSIRPSIHDLNGHNWSTENIGFWDDTTHTSIMTVQIMDGWTDAPCWQDFPTHMWAGDSVPYIWEKMRLFFLHAFTRALVLTVCTTCLIYKWWRFLYSSAKTYYMMYLCKKEKQSHQTMSINPLFLHFLNNFKKCAQNAPLSVIGGNLKERKLTGVFFESNEKWEHMALCKTFPVLWVKNCMFIGFVVL